MSHVNVIGANLPAPDPAGGQPFIPPRLNIVDLIKNEKQWSLYIQALSRLQKTDQKKPLSWFAIGGIHGFPVETEWEKGGDKTKTSGYCAHLRPHFPTWHRPYVALYEQALQAAALEVAQNYKTDTGAWVQAALTLRSPYWDWADPATFLPPRQVYDTVEFKNLRITTPHGPDDFPNPLLAYTFQSKITWPFPQPTTVRHPNSSPAASIKAFEISVGQADLAKLDVSCWETLSRTNSWLEFSNEGVTKGQTANSLETLHGWIHTRTGGFGHMGNTISAAFDPLFMLHHTNVDRQLALWQALHPGVWISNKGKEGSFFKKDLNPFWKDSKDFYNSSDDPVRHFTKFNATYPEFVGLENLSDTEIKSRVQAKVDALYNSRATRVSRTAALTRGFAPAAFSAQAVAATPATQATAPQGLTALQRLDWFVRIRVNKFQLKQSFSILLFLGPVPDNVAEWRLSPYLVGNHSQFVNSEPDHCTNCMENADIITEGFIKLDPSLERMGYVDKTEEEIEKFIQDELQWGIQKIDGTVVSASEFETLEVAVMTLDVTDPAGRAVHRNLTSDKAGGRVPGQKNLII